jgi:uncharacterized OB-fold protein
MSDIRACTICARIQAYPMPVCPGCGGTAFRACTLPMPATIYSHTTVSRAPNPELAARVPYTAVLVRGMQGGLLLLPFQADGPPVIDAVVSVEQHEGGLVARLA